MLGWLFLFQNLASKNVHGFTQEQGEQMAETWEATPAHMLTLDCSVRKLLRGMVCLAIPLA